MIPCYHPETSVPLHADEAGAENVVKEGGNVAKIKAAEVVLLLWHGLLTAVKFCGGKARNRFGGAPVSWICVWISTQALQQPLLRRPSAGRLMKAVLRSNDPFPSEAFCSKALFAAAMLNGAVNNVIIQVTGREQGKTNYSFSINVK